ncbi:MAG: GAF domain-containing protein [Chloroflexi bacterium]|nr:GAF domain-containing protein [Chloroflexota bacterium]
MDTTAPQRNISDTLVESYQATKSAWVVVLSFQEDKWQVSESEGLKKSSQKALHKFLEQKKLRNWLNKRRGDPAVSYRSTGEYEKKLGCQRVHALSQENSDEVILFGADKFTAKTKQAAQASAAAIFEEPSPAPSSANGRLHDFALINQIVQNVDGLTDLQEIANRAATQIAEAFNYEVVGLVLLDETGERLVIEGTNGIDLNGFPTSYSRHIGVTGKVLNEGESVLVNDASQNPDYLPIPDSEPGSEMCVPLREGEDVFGVINIESQQKNAFDEAELQALEALAGILASVILYARRYHQLQLDVRQLQAVRDTALDISADLDLEALLRRIVVRARALVDARGAELGLLDEAQQVVRVLVSVNPWQDYTGYTFPLMSGVAGRVAAIGEPIVVADYNSWSGKREEDYKAPFTTVAGVPLKISGEVIGALTLQDDRPERSFDAEDIQILQLLAPQVAIFIRNARLYQELEERIAAQRLAEERLIRSAKLAAVGEMAAGVAHELNNPLTTVTGFSELILEELPEDFSQRADMEMVLKEARRARKVVRRLLDFSRPSEILRQRVDINEILGDILTLVHHLAVTSQVDMRVQLWDDLPEIRVDRNQIQQVLLNLVHNGIQAMPGGGEMIIKTRLENKSNTDWITVAVEDSGIGIAEKDLPHIFEPFYTTKPTGEGTGLGLSVSYGIVSDHGGYIDVFSQLGRGARFTVWLPIEPENEAPNA